MEEAALQHELRQIRRRRIEIRSMKAALDMEDLHLDDRQSTIEQLLRARMIVPRRPVIDQQRVQQNNNTVSFRPPRPNAIVHSETSHDTRKVNQREIVKGETRGTEDRKTVIAIDDDEGDDGDVKMSANGNKTPSSSDQLRPKVPNTIRTLQPRLLSDSTKLKQNNNPSSTPQQTPSKIVTLRVRYDPTQPRRVHNSQTKTLKRPMPQTPLSSSSSLPYINPPQPGDQPSRKKRLQNSPPSSHYVQPLKSIRPNFSPSAFAPHHEPTTSPVSSQKNPRSSISSTHTDQDQACCPCLGRNRNCYTCRGTPAVIAEGRLRQRQVLQQPQTQTQIQNQNHVFLPPNKNKNKNTTPPSSSRLTRHPPTTTANTTTTIPTTIYMTPSERVDLELRFCRRIVAVLWSIRNRNTNPSSSSSTTLPAWSTHLHSHPTVWDILLTSLNDLLKRRPVAREDREGVWDGSMLVCKVGGLAEFVEGVKDVLGKLRGKGEGGEDGWTEGFWRWFEDRVGRCRECVVVCEGWREGMGGLREWRGVVDGWEVE